MLASSIVSVLDSGATVTLYATGSDSTVTVSAAIQSTASNAGSLEIKANAGVSIAADVTLANGYLYLFGDLDNDGTGTVTVSSGQFITVSQRGEVCAVRGDRHNEQYVGQDYSL